MKSLRVVLIIVLALLIEIPFTTFALSQIQPMSTQQLTEQSTAVVLGTCEQMESYWTDGNSKIFTRIKIRGQQYLKGDLGAEAEITVPGGQIGNTIYEVTDMPVFRKGEEVLLFIWSHPTGKQLVIGGTQGKFSIETDKTTGKKVVVGVELRADPATGLQKTTTQDSKGEKKVFLDDFLSEVRGYVK